MIVVLAAAIAMGTTPVEGATGYSWTVVYRDGAQETYSTVDPRLDFTPRTGRCFTLSVCADPALGCSTPSYEVCADPLLGDTSPFDGTVGAPDWAEVGQHFGTIAP